MCRCPTQGTCELKPSKARHCPRSCKSWDMTCAKLAKAHGSTTANLSQSTFWRCRCEWAQSRWHGIGPKAGHVAEAAMADQAAPLWHNESPLKRHRLACMRHSMSPDIAIELEMSGQDPKRTRTSRGRFAMSAFDPKRTSEPFSWTTVQYPPPTPPPHTSR